jgi:hypothetical protein
MVEMIKHNKKFYYNFEGKKFECKFIDNIYTGCAVLKITIKKNLFKSNIFIIKYKCYDGSLIKYITKQNYYNIDFVIDLIKETISENMKTINETFHTIDENTICKHKKNI